MRSACTTKIGGRCWRDLCPELRVWILNFSTKWGGWNERWGYFLWRFGVDSEMRLLSESVFCDFVLVDDEWCHSISSHDQWLFHHGKSPKPKHCFPISYYVEITFSEELNDDIMKTGESKIAPKSLLYIWNPKKISIKLHPESFCSYHFPLRWLHRWTTFSKLGTTGVESSFSRKKDRKRWGVLLCGGTCSMPCTVIV